MTNILNARICGGCTACCKTHCITDIQKPSGLTCVHCRVGQGCGIYATRPGACQDYHCAWLQGSGEDADRPDKIGFVTDYLMITFADQQIPVASLCEIDSGHIAQPANEPIIAKILASGCVVRKFLITDHKRQRIVREYCFPNGLLTDSQKPRFIEILDSY